MSIRAGAIVAAADRAPAPRTATDWPALLPDVARRLLADRPCREHGGDLRYGSRGSLVVHPQAGTWHDFEAGAGGGTLALVEHVLQTDRAGALRWLVDVGLIDPPSGAEARPAAPQRPAGTSTPAPAPVVAPPAPKPNAMAAVAAAILVAAVPADDTPAREYLARRMTWPPAGPDLPPAVRWLPPSAWANLPTWPGPDGRPRRLTPPRDGVTRLVAGTPPVPACGAVVFELARPGCAPDAVELEAVTAAGNRPAERWRRSPGNDATGRTFEVAAPTGGPWPDADAAPLVVAVVEGVADALALARLRLPGVLVRAATGTGGMRAGGGALVADLPAATAACLVSDGDRPGRVAVTKLHADLHDAGLDCYSAVLIGGDLDELLRQAGDADLADRHGERAAILEHDGELDRPAATARALARLLETLRREA